MPFSVQPVSPADAKGLAPAMMGAMYTDPHWVILWNDISFEKIVADCEQRLPLNLVNGTTTKRHQIAVDVETGEVVGYARWVLPPALAEEKAWSEAQVAEPSAKERQLFQQQFRNVTDLCGRLKHFNHSLASFQSRPLEERDATIMKDGPYLTLDYLTVAPAFQRRGIATMLVQSGLEVADAHYLKAYVMSSPAGLKVYLNHGFQIVQTVSQDYSQYGGASPHIHHFLTRPAMSV